MVRALERGISLSDFNDLTIGMLTDYITTYNNIYNTESKEGEARAATQEDFDNF